MGKPGWANSRRVGEPTSANDPNLTPTAHSLLNPYPSLLGGQQNGVRLHGSRGEFLSKGEGELTDAWPQAGEHTYCNRGWGRPNFELDASTKKYFKLDPQLSLSCGEGDTMDSIHSYFNPNFNQTIALPTPLSFQTKKSQTAYELKICAEN